VNLPGEAGVRVIPLEDYVGGVVAGEIAVGTLDARVALEVLSLQAVIARTYAIANLGRHARDGFDLCSTTHCQVYRVSDRVLPANRPLIDAAVQRTTGQVLTFGGRPALALFHADCGGQTSAAEHIWGGEARPYLRAVRDDTCARDPASAWSFAVTRIEARDALNKNARTAVGSRLDHISVVQRDESGRVVLVALDGERSPLVRGEELRAVLSRQFGDRAVRSPRFHVRDDSGRLRFEGRGRGHGAGLCQRGAMARLQAGASVAQVLATYYPGTVLTGNGPPGPGWRVTAGRPTAPVSQSTRPGK
jgi:stage II sporulation protein D